MATAGDLQRLLDNDPSLTTLFLSLDRHVDPTPLTRALRANGTVQEAVVYLDESFDWAMRPPAAAADSTTTTTPIPDLLVALASLPRLSTMSFNSRPGSDGVLTLDALRLILQTSASGLVSLGLSDLHLQGNSPQEFEQLAETMSGLHYLQDFCLMECDLVSLEDEDEEEDFDDDSDADDEEWRIRRPAVLARRRSITSSNTNEVHDNPLDPLLISMSILPSLKKLYLHARGPNGLKRVSSAAASALCLSASLEELKLRNFTLDQDTTCVMAQLLQWNTTLRDLNLGTFAPDFNSKPASTAVAQLLTQNSTLKQLEWSLQEMISDDCAVTLANALKVNSSLKTFTLTIMVEQPARGGRASSRFRHDNRRRQVHELSPACHDAFLEMLKVNYVLEDLVLFAPFPVKRIFKFYTTLNRMGRGDLLRNQQATPADWIQTLAKVKDDVNALFYYVSVNPSLCPAAVGGGGHNSPSRKQHQPDQEILQEDAGRAAAEVPPPVAPLLFPPVTAVSLAQLAASLGLGGFDVAARPNKKRRTDDIMARENVFRDKLMWSILAPSAPLSAIAAASVVARAAVSKPEGPSNVGGAYNHLPSSLFPALR